MEIISYFSFRQGSFTARLDATTIYNLILLALNVQSYAPLFPVWSNLIGRKLSSVRAQTEFRNVRRKVALEARVCLEFPFLYSRPSNDERFQIGEKEPLTSSHYGKAICS